MQILWKCKNIHPNFAVRYKTGQKNRWKHLAIGLVALIIGARAIFLAYPYLASGQSILEKIQIENKPENLTTELWLIAEVRRTVSFFEHRNKIIAMAMIECVIGIIIVASSFMVLAPTLLRWKDGGRELQNSRLFLLVYDESQLRQEINSASDST